MKKILIFLVVLNLSFQASCMKATDNLNPIDYLESMINYCTGKPRRDFCSKEQIEFGLFFLWNYKNKIQSEIELKKQELIHLKKQDKMKLKRKQLEELRQHQLKQTLRQHFLDRHI